MRNVRWHSFGRIDATWWWPCVAETCFKEIYTYIWDKNKCCIYNMYVQNSVWFTQTPSIRFHWNLINSFGHERCEKTRTMKSPYYTVTDLIKALPGNSSVNTSQHAVVYGKLCYLCGLCHTTIEQWVMQSVSRQWFSKHISVYRAVLRNVVTLSVQTFFCGVCAECL
jgi:hypothetical protein